MSLFSGIIVHSLGNSGRHVEGVLIWEKIFYTPRIPEHLYFFSASPPTITTKNFVLLRCFAVPLADPSCCLPIGYFFSGSCIFSKSGSFLLVRTKLMGHAWLSNSIAYRKF